MKSQISRRLLLGNVITATSLSTALARSVAAEANDIHAIAEEAYIWGLPLWLQENTSSAPAKAKRR